MSRFKVSKYKNAISQPFKKENWIHDLNVSSLNSNGDNIKASCSFVAFQSGASAGSVAVLPLGSAGRFSSFPLVSGHQGYVTDFDFSPFHDNLLATGSEDFTVKLWGIPPDGIDGVMSQPTGNLATKFEKRIESVLFHPAADNVLAVSSGTAVNVCDVEANQSVYELREHQDVVQGICWNSSGSRLASICKDTKQKMLRVFDPRTSTTCLGVACHSGLKESRVCWLGDGNIIITSGFSQMRSAEVAVWDIRKSSAPASVQSVGGNTGVPMIFHDEDSKLVFVAAKAETAINCYALTDTSPYLGQGPQLYRGSAQHKGMALLPKRAVVAMSCEVTRLLQLTQNAIVPISYCVQRKSYKDFHDDLFPDTRGDVPGMTAAQWCAGVDKPVAKVSMDPSKKPPKKVVNKNSGNQEKPVKQDNNNMVSGSDPVKPAKPVSKDTPPDDSPPTKKVLANVQSSKYRHMTGNSMHRSTCFESLPNLNTTVPSDGNSFQVNKNWIAVPLAGSGGRIAILDRSKPGRLPRDVPCVENSGDIMDFTFDPFNGCRLVVSVDTVHVMVWTIPSDGLLETTTEPSFQLVGHREKVNMLCYHPLADNILATAGYDGNIFIWNVLTQQAEIKLDPVNEPLLAIAWSIDGTKLATVGRDETIRIYDPRNSAKPMKEGSWSGGGHAARIVWVTDDAILLSGFAKNGCRCISVYHISDLSQPRSVTDVDVAPGVLAPYYDEDTKIVFLSAKGDRSVYAYEVLPQDLTLFQLPPYQTSSQQQAACFVDKMECEVKMVQIARGIRLCKNSAEPFLFRVPRVKLDYFQDDLFPPTRDRRVPALTAADWLAGSNKLHQTISLQPDNMQPLSDAPKLGLPPKKYTYDPKMKSDLEKKEELVTAMIDRMGERDQEPLPQDSYEGVSDDEWGDD